MLSYDAVEDQNNSNQIEIAVLRANRAWQACFDAIPDMLLLANAEGRIARCNQAALTKLHGSYGELVGKMFTDLFPEVQSANALGIEYQLFEDKHWYRVSVFPVAMDNGTIYHLHSFQDITRKKEYELEILKEEQYYEALFKAIPESLAVLDSHGMVRGVNPMFEQTFGFTNAEAKGHSIHSLLTAQECRVAAKPRFSGSAASDQSGTFRCISKEGRSLIFSVHEIPVNLNGINHGRLAIFRKVTASDEIPGILASQLISSEALVEQLKGRLLPVRQSVNDLACSLENDRLTPAQIALKNAVEEEMERLRQLLDELQTMQDQTTQRYSQAPVAKGGEPQSRANDHPAQDVDHPKTANEQPHILLVEDNPINQKLMLRLLQKRGCQVSVADNGISALRALAKQRFDLIFMDIQMPEMDGIETTRRIRVREHDDQHQVIIAVTAEGPGGDRMECLRAGMDDYLAKPVEIDRLDSLLEKYIGTATLIPGVPQELPAPQASQEIEMINVAAALPRFGGEIEVYFDFLNRFIKQLKQTDQKMRAAYKNGDIEQLYAISHGLKGTAANFEARAICDLANSLEEVTSNNSLVGAYSLINEISNQIPKVEAFYHNQVLLRKRKAPVLPASVKP